jgi:hypothetical protein
VALQEAAVTDEVVSEWTDQETVKIVSMQFFAAMHTLEGYPVRNRVAFSPWEGEVHLSTV